MPQRARSNTLLSPVFAVALLVCCFGCGGEEITFVPYEVATEYRKQHRTPKSLRPGWRLIAVARRVDRPTAIVHRVEVIPEIAGDLVKMGRRKRRKLVGEVACPSAEHPIWQQLTAGQDVEIDLLTEKRGEFATVSCRSAVL